MLESAIHLINHYPADEYWGTNCTIHWIEINLVDSAIQPLSNRGLIRSDTRTPPTQGLLFILCTFHDSNDEYNADFHIFPPHCSGQAFARFLECERLRDKMYLKINYQKARARVFQMLSWWTNSNGVTIQMNPLQQYFHIVLFVLQYCVVLTFQSVAGMLWYVLRDFYAKVI